MDNLNEMRTSFAPGWDIFHFVFPVRFLSGRERLHLPALEIRRADRIPLLRLTTH